MYIHFDSWQEKYKNRLGLSKVGRPVEFMLEAYDVDVTSVELYVYADGKLIPEIVGMENKSSGRYYATYIPRKSGLYFYYFKLVIRQHEHELVRYYCANGGGQGQLIENSEVLENNSYQLTCYDKTVNAPEWYQNGICYQIFPDRFYNGNLDGYIEGKSGIPLSMQRSKMIQCTSEITTAVLPVGISMVKISKGSLKRSRI